MFRVAVFVLVCLLFFSKPATAQHRYFLRLQATDNQAFVLKKRHYQTYFPDTVQAAATLGTVIENLHEQGYLLAAADSTHWKNDTLTAFVFVGGVFYWEKLSAGNVPEAFLNETDFSEKFFRKKVFLWKHTANLQQKILQTAENQGYPFATIQLDSITFEEEKVSARLHFEPNDLVLFDTLALVGSARIKARTLATLLRIRKGDFFSRERIENVDRLLSKLPFMRLLKPSEVVFSRNQAFLRIFADERKASQFDGIIGFLPNEQQNNNRLLLTGEVNFKLSNLFNSGKSLSLVWQQIKPASPLLNLHYSHPLLFGTNLGADFQLNLLKQDNNFLTVSRRLGLSQSFSNADKLAFFVQLQTSAVLGDSTRFQNLTRLPDVLNTRLLSYGIEYFRNRTDDLFYPKNGWEITASVAAGNKEILKNAAIPAELYDSLRLKSVQLTLRSEVKKYFQLQPRTVLLLKGQAGVVQNGYLSQNELFRLGGLQTVRGFNENTFFASGYGLGTAELRYFLEPETYFFGFLDYAVLQNNWRNEQSHDQPFGTGAGISFSTQAGVFNFVYAVGRSASQPFGFNYSKIHFGYVSRF